MSRKPAKPFGSATSSKPSKSEDDTKQPFGAGIGVTDDFWTAREDALYAPLIELDAPFAIGPVVCNKRDRRGWVALRPRQMTFAFA